MLTHGHFDHILATNTLNVSNVYIHELDKEILNDCNKNAGVFANIIEFAEIKNLTTFKDDENIEFCSAFFKTIHTPGHTKGSSCFIFLDEFMFTGDTLFRKNIGRCDLYGGDFTSIKNSIKKIANLNKDYIILPGHGKASNLNYEKTYNHVFLN